MKTADRITLVEYWTFDPKGGDSCTLRVEATGEVLRREQWPHGKSPAVLTNPIEPAANKVLFAERRIGVTGPELERIRP
jgi:hypothetical protein